MKITRNWKVAAIAVSGLLLFGAGRALADFTFGAPTNLGPKINSSSNEYDPDISADGLELYFQSYRSGGYGECDLYVARRAALQDEWSEPVNLGPVVNSSGADAGPSISSDGLSLYFNSDRTGGSGGKDLYVTTRQSNLAPWGPPVNLGPAVNSSADEISPNISADGLSLFFSDADAPGNIARPGGYGGADIWVSHRQSLSEAWETPVNAGQTLNLSFVAGAPDISADGLTLLLCGYRINSGNTYDLWLATRERADAPWSELVNLGPLVNSNLDADLNPSLSADGRMLYFASFRPGGIGSNNSDLWQVPINPVVDLNRDDMVDGADVAIMLEHWKTNDTLCDIGPNPFGDGIVDARDLSVLAERMFEEVLPPELLAYWRFDEAEGDVACDSTGVHDGVLSGSPQWQPGGGRVAGTLEFDGIDDYVGTGLVLDPSEGSLSAFAWINGGKPGEVIISQSDGAGSGEAWLGIESSSGALMTGLMPRPGRSVPKPLVSQTIVADGRWHHVGVVWDGRYRCLYVDGAEVAGDIEPAGSGPLKFSNGGMCIGAGKTLQPGSFFTGMIDDVRIYDGMRTPQQINALVQRAQ